MILKKHNVVHYGEVLLLVLQDYQLDNGSRLEKFRGKEGQTVHRVFHLAKKRFKTDSQEEGNIESPCVT